MSDSFSFHSSSRCEEYSGSSETLFSVLAPLLGGGARPLLSSWRIQPCSPPPRLIPIVSFTTTLRLITSLGNKTRKSCSFTPSDLISLDGFQAPGINHT